MNTDFARNPHIAVKAGALLFALWGLLHIWVGFEGTTRFLSGDIKYFWQMVIGGSASPTSSFVYPFEPTTVFANRHLLENFVVDVAGYGVLGFFVAWGLWTKSSWFAYLIGFIAIGIADLTFLFVMVLSGVTELNFASLAGPAIWVLAVAITPFGLRATGEPRQG